MKQFLIILFVATVVISSARVKAADNTIIIDQIGSGNTTTIVQDGSGNTASVTAGTISRYMYIAADYKWYRIA